MAIAYSGSTIVNTTFTQTTGTRGELVTELITRLLAAGWSNVSGSSTDQVLKCAATTVGSLQLAVRVYDPGSGNCARVALRNVSGSRIGQDLYLVPAVGKQWRIIANKHQFFCMTPGASAAREFVCATQLIIPSWLGTTVNCGFAQGNGSSDSDTAAISTRPSLRSHMNSWQNNNSGSRTTNLAGDSLLDIPVPGAGITFVAGIHLLAQYGGGNWAYRWTDGTLLAGDALAAFGTASTGAEPVFQGQLSDAVIITGTFAADTNISLDGHTWTAIQHNHTGSVTGSSDQLNLPPGTLFIMTS